MTCSPVGIPEPPPDAQARALRVNWFLMQFMRYSWALNIPPQSVLRFMGPVGTPPCVL